MSTSRDLATDWTIQGLNPCEGKIYLVPKTTQPALGHTQPPVQWVPGSFP